MLYQQSQSDCKRTDKIKLNATSFLLSSIDYKMMCRFTVAVYLFFSQ